VYTTGKINLLNDQKEEIRKGIVYINIDPNEEFIYIDTDFEMNFTLIMNNNRKKVCFLLRTDFYKKFTKINKWIE